MNYINKEIRKEMEMKFIAAICPKCSGSLQVPNDRDNVKCMYCGVDILVREAVKLGEHKINPQNYMELAKEAENSGNYSEANAYYMKVLEIDPKNYQAWQGKGTSSGWQSNLMVCRFDETINSYRKSLELAPSDAMRDVLKIEMSMSMLVLAQKYFDLSLEHALKFIAAKDSQFEYADRVKNAIQLCDFAIYLNPDSNQAKSFVADIANRASKISFLSSGDAKFFKEKKMQYSLFLKKSSDPSDNNGHSYGWHEVFYIIGMVFVYFILTGFFEVKNIIGLIFGVLFLPALFSFAFVAFLIVVLQIRLKFGWIKNKK